MQMKKHLNGARQANIDDDNVQELNCVLVLRESIERKDGRGKQD